MRKSGNGLEWLKSACVKVICEGSEGSGYFVTENQVVTCEHVIRPVGRGGRVSLSLSDGSTREAQVVRVDESADAALLKVAAGAPTPTPLRLVDTVGRNRPFEVWGFPGGMQGNPLLLNGDVHDPVGHDPRGATALVLFSKMVAAGSGALMQGYSGSPVAVDGAVVGHLRRVMVDEYSGRPSAEMGLVFATPAREVLRLLQDEGLHLETPGPVQPPGAPYSRQWYISRPRTESLALDYLGGPGTPAVLHGPRLSGKSWLMTHVVGLWREQWPQGRVARINLLELGDANADMPAFAEQLARRICDKLDGNNTWLTTFLAGRATPMIRLGTMLERHALRTGVPTLLALDAADAVLGHPPANDFFGSLRAWMDEATDPPWNQLRLLLAISTTPARVVASVTQSPFNIVERVALGLLTREQVGDLATRYGLPLTEGEGRDLHALTGGHPYLVRRVLYDVKTGDGARVPGPTAEVFEAHLRSLLRFVERQSLLKVLKTLLTHPEAPVTLDQEEFLKKAGLVRRNAAGGLEPTCTLYRDFFAMVP